MVCDEDGHVAGSLSGGCVEEDLIEKLATGELASAKPQFHRYGESDEEAEKFGLPCGGHLDIVVEPLGNDEDTRSDFNQIAQRMQERKLVRYSLNAVSGQRDVSPVSNQEPFHYSYENSFLSHTFGPTHQIFVIGSSMVAEYVAEFAKSLEFKVTVCDPRKERIEAFPVEGVTLIQDMPDDAIQKYANDAQSAIVALTHDPRIDDMGLLGAFETPAFYIGAMGSSRTSAKRRERLKLLDVADASLERLHAPIGISIGSKTPPEIALSVLAEIVATRAALKNPQKVAVNLTKN